MKPELIVIDTLEGLLELRSYLNDFDYVAFDTETTGLSKHDRIIGFSICAEESKAYYVILEKWQEKLIPMPYLQEARDLVLYLQNKQLIMHNAIFDCMITNAYLKIDLMPYLHTDTMILAHLLDENRRVGLKELTSTIFGEDSANEAKEMKDSVLKNGGKLTKKCYEMFKCDSYIMGKYGAKDALLTYKLFIRLIPQLYEQKLADFFYEEESMPLLRGSTYDLNTTGLLVDSSKLLLLKKTLEAECAEAKAFIYSEIYNKIKDKYPGTTTSNTFNIGAPQQLSWLLFKAFGLEFGNLTASGKNVCKALGLRLPYSPGAKREFISMCEARVEQFFCPAAIVNGKAIKGKKIREPWAYITADKKILTKLAPKYKWIAKLLEYQKKMKILNTYVSGIEARTQYGVINPSFLQHGTTSGRYSSRDPNFQNLPRDDKRIKECIVARPGKVFVGADYSQLEPRVFAYFSKDQRLLSSFKKGEDFYSIVGREVYDKLECLPLKEGVNAFGALYSKLRQDSKTFTLASTYGATGHQLAPLMNKTPDEAQEDINSYFEKFPSVAEMMKESHMLAKENGFVLSLFGRPRRIPDAKKINRIYGSVDHSDLPYEARKLLNLSVNHRIQSTSASIVNRAAIRFYDNCKKAGIDCKLVVQVHDSLVAECFQEDSETVSLLLQDAMENTSKLEGIDLIAEPRIGNKLSLV